MGRPLNSKNKVLKRVIKQCLKCQTSFEVYPNRALKRKYCSHSCSAKSLSIQARNAISLALTGIKKGQFTSTHREKISQALKGKTAWNKGMIGYMAKESHYKWKTDRNTLKKYIGSEERRSQLYKCWRKEVWVRDEFRCKINNKDCGGRIEAHHILSWSDYPELRYQINNGITLCHAHHPRKRADEKRLSPYFQDLVSVSKV